MAKKTKSLAVDQKTLQNFYKEMLFNRRFEERANIAYTQQKFSGFCHLHIGQEAMCVGVIKALRKSDYIISGYRSHTQAIAKGIEPKYVFSELLGKVTGCSKGRGGSMHMFSAEHRFLGGHGIVGGQAPIAVGAALKVKYKDESDIVVCFLGDAAMNQGQVFEAMNMAAIWKLPVLFIIENNQYGMGTAIRRTTNIEHLQQRADGVGMESSQSGGMDVVEVYEHTQQLVEKMRKDSAPHLWEALTYRYKGHSVADPETYRSKEEVEEHKQQDPLTLTEKYMLKQKWVDAQTLKTWDKDAKSQVKEALSFAEQQPEPEDEETWKDVFVEQ